MEVVLNPETEEKVKRLAASNESVPSDYVSQLVERYVDHDEWFRQEAQVGFRSLEAGESLTHEQVGERLRARQRR